MKTSLDIRPINADDLPQLSNLYRQFWGEESSVTKMREQLSTINSNKTHILLGAFHGSILVGSIMGVQCEELYGNGDPFLVMENLIVDKTYRKEGIGRALITGLEEQAASRGCVQIIFVTERNREDACQFYAAMGYDPEKYCGFKKTLKMETP